MPRKPRFTINNGFYHVLSRGHNKKTIFHNDRDFSKYLKLLLTGKISYGLKIYNYTLMSNHVHLIIMSPTGVNLSRGMRFLNQTYAQYYRAKYGGVGYVWQGRFKSFLIQSGRYLLTCAGYIEINPVKAGIVSKPWNYRWSSCRAYISDYKNKLLDLNPEYLGLSNEIVERRKTYAQFLQEEINEAKERRNLERYFRAGVCGDREFIKRLEKKGLRQTGWHRGRPGKPGKNI